MLGRTDSRARLLLLLCFLGLFAGALTLRLAYWQIGQGDELRTLADQQLADPAEAQTRRGEIVDSGGSVLATTAYRDRLAAYPDLMNGEDRPKIARRLGEILGMNGEQIDDLISTFDGVAPDPAPQYTVVARRLTVDQSDQVREGLRSGDLAAVSSPTTARAATASSSLGRICWQAPTPLRRISGRTWEPTFPPCRSRANRSS